MVIVINGSGIDKEDNPVSNISLQNDVEDMSNI